MPRFFESGSVSVIVSSQGNGMCADMMAANSLHHGSCTSDATVISRTFILTPLPVVIVDPLVVLTLPGR